MLIDISLNIKIQIVIKRLYNYDLITNALLYLITEYKCSSNRLDIQTRKKSLWIEREWRYWRYIRGVGGKGG